jgi:hypothetical protein
MKLIISVLILSILSGCSAFQTKKPVQIACIPIEKPKLQVDLPSPVELQSVKWSLSINNDILLISLDEQGYKALSINNAKILGYIREQNSIIAAYRKYYESSPFQPEKR